MEEKTIIPIQDMIYEIRGQKVMLDSDLAKLYGVPTHRLNETVKRNIKRFPSDFMFQFTKDEFTEVIANCDHLLKQKFRAIMPFAFTEQGVAMLASVINSQKAIDVNIEIMRTFVQLRRYVISQSGTSEQIAELRKLLLLYIDKNDKRVNDIVIALNNLIEQPKPAKKIGFGVN